jgi:hypothetical protein
VLLCWWAAFHPGVLSPDSVAAVWRVGTGHWASNASVLYDCLTWVSLRVTGTVALVTLLQTVLLASALTCAATTLRRLGVPPSAAAAAAVGSAVLPSVGAFCVTLWKDVPFSICGVLIFVTTVRIVLDGRGKAVVLLGAEFLVFALLRNNAFVMVAIATVVLVLFLPGLRWRLAAAGAAAIVAWGLIYGLVYPALGVQPPSRAVAFAPTYSDVSAAFQEFPNTFTQADRKLLAQVAPLAAWRNADCSSVDSLVYGSKFSWAAAESHSDQLVELWSRVLRRTPGSVLGTRICRGSIAWSPFPAARNSYKYSNRIPPDRWRLDARGEVDRMAAYRPGLRYRPLWRPLTSAARFLRDASTVRQLEWLLWRGAFWSYVAYAALAVLARRHGDRRFFATGAVVVGQQFGVLLTTPAQDARYMAGPLIIGVLSLTLLAVRVRPAPAVPGPREQWLVSRESPACRG